MYAILQHGGHQYRVASGDRILVDRIPVEVGSTVTLESVLLIGDGAETDVAKGSPVEASVTATVIAHRRGRKIRVFTYKPKKRHRRTLGYRSQLTELRIDDVARGKAEEKPKSAAKPRKAAEPKAAAAAAPAEAAVSEAPKKATGALAVEEAPSHAETEAVEAVAAAGEDEEATEDAEAVDDDAVEAKAPAKKPAAAKSAAAKPRAPRAKKDPADGA
jgi:large subunit ribosomal protein L21